ncbi:hypothetical protein RhiirC2_800654 [Rhizophagus irregularis]|uniref:Uncharacterized protein n=1 Tax=Rhizophagus irregularis TaxID=588596 RepID=A0A2N1M3C7_9GLOM|nr:hypothetical protein RhiirC2_800654 [Rhizophagus irregularis]
MTYHNLLRKINNIDIIKIYSKFLANFRLRCLKAIITNLQEIKNRLLETYSSNEFFKHEFPKKISGVTSINELYSESYM